MEKLGDDSSEPSSPEHPSEEIIVVSDEETPPKKADTPGPKAESQVADQAGSSRANSVGPSMARRIIPPAHHRQVIEVNLSSDDEPMPIATRKEATPPNTATVRRRVPCVAQMTVINDELRQQLHAVINT